jgi:hypothetical protein
MENQAMSTSKTVVDSAPPDEIAKAIKKVNQTPGLRIRTGAEALWTLYKAPSHSMLRSQMDEKFGALDLHFGWFCRRVAEELGANDPDTLALVDSSDSGAKQVLTLKASVAAAMRSKVKKI